jgi:hypothetical protein
MTFEPVWIVQLSILAFGGLLYLDWRLGQRREARRLEEHRRAEWDRTHPAE